MCVLVIEQISSPLPFIYECYSIEYALHTYLSFYLLMDAFSHFQS